MLATVRYARALILSSYHVLYLHNTSINQTLTTRIPVYNLLDKYRIKLLKNPKLDTRLRGMALAGHNLIWPRSSLRTSRKRAERSLRSVTWPRTRARVSLGRLLSVQFFPSPLPPSLPHPLPLPLSLSPPRPFFLRHARPPLVDQWSALQSGAATCTTWWIPSREPDGEERASSGTVSIFCHPGVFDDRFDRPLSLCRFIVSWPIRDNCRGNGSSMDQDRFFQLQPSCVSCTRARVMDRVCAQVCFIMCEIFLPPVIHG